MAFVNGKPIRAAAPVPGKISPDSYLYLQQWIYRESGIVIDQDKAYLLQSRLALVLESEKLGTIENLCAKLRNCSPGLARQVVDAITTNETLFFRDMIPFEAMRAWIIPKLLTNRIKGQKLTFWSAAASSGQEAYSLAMLLLEMGLTGQDVDIFGSDLSDGVLTRARLGLYRNFEVSRGLPPSYIDKYFDRVGTEWQVREQVRRMVRFQQLDLRSSLKHYGPFNVVFCRNVLIYFDPETKAAILREIRNTIAPGGYLVLGAAETAGNLNQVFQREVLGEAVAYAAV
jgi:chemotaxis protein methyltransferase CheR